jgi:hypothetical protein
MNVPILLWFSISKKWFEHRLKLQQITRKSLYYSQAVDPTMNIMLSTTALQQTKATEQTKKDADKFLNYCSLHLSATMCYHASNMILKLHSDASYNSESGAHSRMGGHFYLGSCTSDDDTKQGTILASTAIMQAVLHTPSRRHSLQQRHTSDATSAKLVNRLSSFLPCSLVMHPLPISIFHRSLHHM